MYTVLILGFAHEECTTDLVIEDIFLRLLQQGLNLLIETLKVLIDDLEPLLLDVRLLSVVSIGKGLPRLFGGQLLAKSLQATAKAKRRLGALFLTDH